MSSIKLSSTVVLMTPRSQLIAQLQGTHTYETLGELIATGLMGKGLAEEIKSPPPPPIEKQKRKPVRKRAVPKEDKRLIPKEDK